MAPLFRTFWLVAWPFLMGTTLLHGAIEARTTLDIEHNLNFEGSIKKASSVSPEDFTQTVLRTLQSNIHVALVGLAQQAVLEPAHPHAHRRMGEFIAPPLLALQAIRLQIWPLAKRYGVTSTCL